jgi:hypothetical protein
MMRTLMPRLGPRLEWVLYGLLLAKVVGLEVAIWLILIGIPILIVRVPHYRTS